MARKTQNHPLDLPPLELDCMRILWSLEEATVQEVRAGLLPDRALAYTTVMTVMEHLARKGMVERRKRGRPFVYRALRSQHEACEHALDRLTRNFFLGSREHLRQYLGPPHEIGGKAADATGKHAGDDGQNGTRPSTEIDPSLL